MLLWVACCEDSCGRTIYIYAYVVCTMLLCTCFFKWWNRLWSCYLIFRVSWFKLRSDNLFLTIQIWTHNDRLCIAVIGGFWGVRLLVLRRLCRAWRPQHWCVIRLVCADLLWRNYVFRFVNPTIVRIALLLKFCCDMMFQLVQLVHPPSWQPS